MKPLITLSQKAIMKCRKILDKHSAKALKLSLSSGGCNGFEYKFLPTNKGLEKGDDKVSQDGINIYVCGKSQFYLLGTNIDWKTDIMGSRFQFDNPNAQSICGCGTSFNPSI